jgi:hypothetical protein
MTATLNTQYEKIVELFLDFFFEVALVIFELYLLVNASIYRLYADGKCSRGKGMSTNKGHVLQSLFCVSKGLSI